MIEVNNIHKHYGRNHVLHGVSFKVPKGEITGLIGPNGSGKSTTIRILTGYVDADDGEVLVGGNRMSVSAVEVKRLIGYAPESAPSYREQTTTEYLRFIAQLRGIQPSRLGDEIERAITAFALKPVAQKAIQALSKGYRHRVSLAQCLLGDPPVIVLDEPTDGLDPAQKIATREMIMQLAETKAILLTTHLLEEVDTHCSRVVALNEGCVVFDGATEDAKHHGSSGIVVKLKVAGDQEGELRAALTGLAGLDQMDIAGNDGTLHCTLNYMHALSERDVMEPLSEQLFSHQSRIIEMYVVRHNLNDFFTASTKM